MLWSGSKSSSEKKDAGSKTGLIGLSLPGVSDVPSLITFLCVHSAAKPSREQALQARSTHSYPLRTHEAQGLTPSHRILSRLSERDKGQWIQVIAG